MSRCLSQHVHAQCTAESSRAYRKGVRRKEQQQQKQQRRQQSDQTRMNARMRASDTEERAVNSYAEQNNQQLNTSII